MTDHPASGEPRTERFGPPNDWKPTCKCDPPCRLQQIAALDRGGLIECLVNAEEEVEMYRHFEAEARATRGRGQGKTTEMLRWAREAPDGEHRVIVTPTQQEAMRLLRENSDLASWQFVSIDEVGDRHAGSGVLYGRGGRIVLGIDNLDLALSRLFYWPVGAFSFTAEGEQPVDNIVTRRSVAPGEDDREPPGADS